ncbi:hypothetical protein LINPERHAP1_LOCUS6936 [Linum perenne]
MRSFIRPPKKLHEPVHCPDDGKTSGGRTQ